MLCALMIECTCDYGGEVVSVGYKDCPSALVRSIVASSSSLESDFEIMGVECAGDIL